MRPVALLSLLSLCALAACGKPSGSTTAHTASGDTDTDADTDTSDTGPVIDEDYLEVAAFGFEYLGGWNQEEQLLENYLYTDSAGDLAAGGPVVIVTLTSLAYFSMDSSTAGFEDEYCEFVATFHYGVSDTLTGTAFNWAAGKGSTEVALETWGAFEGYLEVLPDTFSDRCLELDPEVFDGGDPTAVMDHMHFGLGFGPPSDHLVEFYSEGESYATYEKAFMSQFIAMNHPDGEGGYTFEAFDWNGAYLVETDYDECLDVDDGAGGTFEVCGLYQVDDDDYYVPGNAKESPRHGYVRGFSAWLEDTPNVDLSLFQDGTSGM